MIAADTDGPFEALAARLFARARRLAAARGESRALARRNDPRRWRKAGLLWPLFADR